MLTQTFIDMIYLFSCGALGKAPLSEIAANIQDINKLAEKHDVLHIVYLAEKYLYDNKRLNMPSDAYCSLKYNTLNSVTRNIKRNYFMHKVINKFKDEGLNYCVLKGEVLSSLYAAPDFRISSDTDMYIDAKDTKQAISILKKLNFTVKKYKGTSHHIRANHPIGGLLELHLHLHDEIFEDVWFDHKMLNQEEFRTIKAEDGTSITTLGITDGLIFITLHYIKHFLSCGVGIRQLMDVLLYMKKYKDEINWDRFNELLHHLKYKKFVDNTIDIGIKYLHFIKGDLPLHECDENIMDKILTDIEKGGVFGKHDAGRSGFYLEYTKARFSRFKKEDYDAYVKKWWRPNVIKAIFPSVRSIAVKFPYVKKTTLLYPVAWIHRVIKLLTGIIKKEKSVYKYINPQKAVENNETIKKRMELIRELDMI